MPIQLPQLDRENLVIPDRNLRTQASPNDFGAQEAQALGAVAQGTQRVAEVAHQIDDDYNEANAQELDTELSRRIRDRLYNPESGYLSTARGRTAVDQRAQVEADIDGLATEVGQQARSPRAAQMFSRAARARADSALGQIATHATEQTRAYQNEQSEAVISESVDNAVAGYHEPAIVAANIDTAIGEIQRLAQREGWDDTIVQNRVRRVQSDVNSRVIVQLAAVDPNGAEEYYQRILPTLTAQDAAELRTTMRAAQTQARERVTGAVYQALANGQDYRAIPEWSDFTSNPLFGTEHEAFNEHLRARARAAAEGSTNAARISRAVGNDFLALAADTRNGGDETLDLIVRAGQGTLRVGEARGGHTAAGANRIDMTSQEFEQRTGISYAEAVARFRALQGDDLRQVLTAVNNRAQSQVAAISSVVENILDYAEPAAQAAGVNIEGRGNEQRRAQLRTYVFRRVQAATEAGRPVDVEAITRDALADVSRGGLFSSRRRGFQPTPYGEIPQADRDAIEERFRRSRGRDPSHDEVVDLYDEYRSAAQ